MRTFTRPAKAGRYIWFFLSVSLAAAGPDVPAADGTTALHRAVGVNDAQKSEALIRAGADVNAVNRYGVTALSLAAGNGNAALLESLFESGADAKAADAALRD
jgi:ankyrin repeat protein